MHLVHKFRYISNIHNGSWISGACELLKFRPWLQSSSYCSSNLDEAPSAVAASTNEKCSTNEFERIKQHLQDVYDASEEQSSMMLCSADTKDLSEDVFPTIDALKEKGVPLDQLLRNPWILQFDCRKLLMYLSMLQSGEHMFTAASHGLPFCQNSREHIKKYWVFLKHEKSQLPPQYPNKVYYMADKLQINVPLLSESLAKSKHALLAPFSRVVELVDLYIHYGVPEEYILSDPYVLCYSVDFFKKRMEVMYGDHKAVEKRKLWITHCAKDQFDSSVRFYIKNKEEERLLRPFKGSVTAYLAHKLSMRKDVVLLRMQSHMTYSPRPTKIRDIINLLTKQGFTSEQIFRTMGVLQYSYRRLEERAEILRKMGVRRYSMRLLFCPQKQFEVFCWTETCKQKKRQYVLKPLTEVNLSPREGGSDSPLSGSNVRLLNDGSGTSRNDGVDSPLSDHSGSSLNDDSGSPLNDGVDTLLNDGVDSPLNDGVDSPLNDGVDSPLNDDAGSSLSEECIRSCNGR
ncbi:hypothetical protein FHG87_003256 [Trinorchestia longiramus]|nr:hypothetical protein FHG87_003256 [Trinorchestia longiramus]